ncbi:hypothetical protein ABDK09_21500 [Vibrio sp. CDRSL-10 TSBA]
MKNRFTASAKTFCLLTALTTASSMAWAGHHLGVKATDQDVSGGTVSANMIMAGDNGWMVVHRNR